MSGKNPWAAAAEKTGDSAPSSTPAAAPTSDPVVDTQTKTDPKPDTAKPKDAAKPKDGDLPKPPSHVRMYREFPSVPDGPVTADVAIVDVPEWERYGWTMKKNW